MVSPIKYTWLWALLVALFFNSLQSCDKNEVFKKKPEEIVEDSINTSSEITLAGTGSFIFNSYQPLANKPVKVFYHIPDNASSSSPILFILHGGQRDGMASRDQLITHANAHNCILVCPEFTQAHYPGGDAYNLGNIFVDGDNPSPATLNDEALWTFAVIEPIFDKIRQESISNATKYDIFGFSAGAQVAHRYMIFDTDSRVNRNVVAASGWYTMLNNQISFPYGLDGSPAKNIDLGLVLNKSVYIIVGSADNDNNAPGLRRNSEVDVQGLNRLARANYFYASAQQTAINLSSNFNWQKKILPDVDHNFMVNAVFAMDLLY